MNRGYVKLWRKSIDSEIWADPGLWRLWCLCLMLANHKQGHVRIEGQVKPIKVMPGQFVTGRFELHKTFYPTRRKKNKSPLTLWRWMQVLKNMGNLNIKSYAKCSLITINNWSQYQQPEQQMNNRRTTDEQQMNTNKNVKNVKNVKNTPLYIPPQKNGIPYANILDEYHKILPTLPTIQKLSPNLQKKIKARWNADTDRQKLDWWVWYFDGVSNCDYLMGKVNNWAASFHWLIGPENMDKVLSGNYINRDQNKQEIEAWINQTGENSQEL